MNREQTLEQELAYLNADPDTIARNLVDEIEKLGEADP
jgi:hypothetical protein|tara:strand:- start:208 stop:321 length:114 start_codon:yes stop_codon:yes gene_type:complete